MRRRWIQMPGGDLIEVTPDYQAPKREAPHVIADLPDYESPIDGRVVHGRKGRRDDLKRHGCREWAGREQEEKEAARQRAYNEQRSDERLHEAASRAYHQLDPQKRRILENR